MSTPFKMKGWSPFTQKKDHPKKEVPPEHEALEVTRGKTGSEAFDINEDIADINDRISFLQSDIDDGVISAVEGNKKIKELKIALAKLQPK